MDLPPIEDGELRIQGAHIVDHGPSASGSVAIDLGNVAILPALVNAHTHLEFSQLDKPLGSPGMAFHDWINVVLAYREANPFRAAKAIRVGLDESLRAGSVALGEIATGSPAEDMYGLSDMHTVSFTELIGLSKIRVEQQFEMIRQLETSSRHLFPSTEYGLSPHAPYTAHYDLVDHVSRLSTVKHFPMAIHLAETREEIQLLKDQNGPLRELLVNHDVWEPTAFRLGTRPLDYLQLLSCAHRSLIIHGNYLDEEEIQYIGDNRRHMSVVYCPRTHAYFGHSRYPLSQMLDAGVNVALGTDSRASNPDLDLLSEMRYLVHEFPDLSSHAILRMGTINGALALGLDNVLGTLTPGKKASFIAVRLAENDQPDTGCLVLDNDSSIELVVVNGRLRWSTQTMRAAVQSLLDA